MTEYRIEAYKPHLTIARERGHYDEQCEGTMQIMFTDTYESSGIVEIHCDMCDYQAGVPKKEIERR